MSKAKVYFRNENTTDTWLTPLKFINALGEFDLDPCAYPKHETARRLICLPEDGFNTKWKGRVWLNPPYGSECGRWIDKLAMHNQGTALVFARIETKWFQRNIKKASAILFPSSRMRFLRPDGTAGSGASAPSAFIAFGEYDSFNLEMSGIPGWFLNLEGKSNGTK